MTVKRPGRKMRGLKFTGSVPLAKPHGPKIGVACISPRVVGLGLVVFLAGCFGPGSYSPEMDLAKVNGEVVTARALEEAFTARHQGHAPLLAGKGAVRDFLEKVIDRQLLLQEARRIGLDHEPDIEQAMESLRALRAADRFYQDEVKSKVVVSDEAMAAAAERMEFRFQARHIVVESRAAAAEALERVQAGQDFGEVARQVSQAPTASKGGYLGILRWGQLEPDLEERLWSMKPGEISEPFETREGWNLLYATERVAVEPPPLDKVKRYIGAVLAKRQTRQRSDALFHDLAARWKTQIHEKALLEVLKASGAREPSPDVVVAEAAGERITLADLLARVDLDKVRRLRDAMGLRAMRHFLEDDIFRVLLRKEALARGYGEKPEIVREIERRKSELAVDRLLSKVVFAGLDVNDGEAEAYWKAHAEKFTEPEAVRLSIILAETEEEAKSALAEVRSGGDFARLARKLSKDRASAELGGEIGWLVKGRVDPEMERAVFSLPEGESGIARTRFGYVVFQVRSRKAERVKPFVEVREEARTLALREKSNRTLNRWLKKLREASVIEIDEEAIDRATGFYVKKLQGYGGGVEG